VYSGSSIRRRRAQPFYTNVGVDRIAEQAIKAGAKEAKPLQDEGFMQLRNFLDLDGHDWEVVYRIPGRCSPKNQSQTDRAVFGQMLRNIWSN
jgi:hypothetical protein